jgi:hypothetical protein
VWPPSTAEFDACTSSEASYAMYRRRGEFGISREFLRVGN